MNRIPVLILLCCAVLAANATTTKSLKIFALTTSKQAAPARVNGTFRFALDKASLSQAYNEQSFTTTLSKYAFDPTDLNGLDEVELDLRQFSVIGPGTQVIVKTAHGEEIMPLPTIRTFRGSVRGIPGSIAVLSIEPEGKVSGMIRLDNNTYTIGSKSDDLHATYMTKTADIEYIGDLTRCELTNESAFENTSVARPAASAKHSAAMPLATQTMKVAVDVDNACYNFFGGSQGDITNWITARFAAMSAVYEDEIDVGLELGRIYIYSTNDPYTASDINQLLTKFTNHWKANNGSVDRGLAHLFSKQDLGNPGGASGLAWLDAVCSKDIGYAVSRIMGSEQFPGVDESVTAHEIGHNCGSKHTHNCDMYQPPVDSCVAAESDSGIPCYPGTKQVKGTIMSYCNQKNFTFHPRTRTIMKGVIASAPCLGTLAKIQVKMDSIIFPPVGINVKKDTIITAMIRNNGTVPLTITSMQIETINAVDSEFYIKTLPTFPLVLQPNGTHNLTIVFYPYEGGERTANLLITHNASGAVSTIGLRGIGAEPLAVFSTDFIDFGEIDKAGNHDTTLIYVENIGDAPLIISKMEITGPEASDFSIIAGSAPPNVTVPPNQTASFTVRFKAQSEGTKEATLWITHNGFEPPDNVDYIDLSAYVESLTSVKYGNRTATSFLKVTPNPANDKVTVEITSTEASSSNCQILLVDQLGRTVATIASEKLGADGLHKTWQIDPEIANGTYQLIAKIGESTLTERVVILK